jgi:hypothetical protein
MQQYLREWRKNALDKHQYETAIFVADKLLALTSASPVHCSLSQLLTLKKCRQRSGCLVARVHPFQPGKLHPRPERPVKIGPDLAEPRLQASGRVMLRPAIQVRRSALAARRQEPRAPHIFGRRIASEAAAGQQGGPERHVQGP